jgi:hypothetical protein
MKRVKKTPDREPGPSNQISQDLPDEALEEQIVDLPAREALSIVNPGVITPLPGIPAPLGRTADATPPAEGSEPIPPE